MKNNANHLAVLAHQKSIKYAQAKDREAWLALYHDDALVCDPVGKSPLDLEGNGHKGKVALAEFFDNVIAQASVTINAGEHRISGEYSCAVPMQAVNDLAEGAVVTVAMIAVYHVDEAGLILSMQAYWDWSELEQQLQAIMS